MLNAWRCSQDTFLCRSVHCKLFGLATVYNEHTDWHKWHRIAKRLSVRIKRKCTTESHIKESGNLFIFDTCTGTALALSSYRVLSTQPHAVDFMESCSLSHISSDSKPKIRINMTLMPLSCLSVGLFFHLSSTVR